MTQRLPRLAIVTPSYNTGRYIGAAVDSVLEQQDADFNYIVMDGGSTDNTVDVLERFGKRLRWISQKDNGQSDAINRGFGQTEGEILGWLNSDDTYAPRAFRAVAEFFAAHPDVDLVYGDATYTDTRGQHIADCVHVEPYSRHRLFCYSDFLVQPATFFRRRAFEAVGGVDASIHWAMDYDLWLRIVANGSKVAYLPRILANFRWLAENKTATGGWGRLNEIVGILRRQGYGPPAYIQLEQCNMHARDALGALRHGHLSAAFKSTAKGAGIVMTSPRVVGSLLSPHTWRIMWVGQVLRARAAAAQRREQYAEEPATVSSASHA
jgi:glycosyltransferase involved in cell wall biosynthesis